jgi:putative CocE/NonD family hydrolase
VFSGNNATLRDFGADICLLDARAESFFENRRTTMNMLIEKTVMVPMRDGVNLATDIYRPSQQGRFPVLLSRLPYNKDMLDGLMAAALRTVQKGYVVVIQDCRGRFASEGEFSPPFDEATDGADTITWIVQQPWASGKVGMIGGSYLGLTQWQLAKEHPAALRAIAPCGPLELLSHPFSS